ncbi:DNA polymerase III subunit gamma and tau [Catellatospora bangladeshensis]|uniref:DNA polymerase III subunit gamma/tau n=1 Tax=Catellatospora bangladeshensis TaxID=310355 RepID=A0A8J3JAK5_9ACTN|nr:DNA polymerase III subunit gamma and tau [Catellatospora bangladeshensis]GIF81317.1 DNA polymerase III subunit gamma and tau [Catellatospora bangladeshensis]
MALALYRKYRPRTFAEVIGQEHVTEPLIQALKSGRLNHAYLFSGPRGCGKTSSARILARSLNCVEGPTPEPCGVCDSCRALAPDGPGSIDVIEIDAASHGGVDDARELRERAFFAPATSRYKIYIIDEAHMVSSAGFNALLKLVEEPPEYVKFVFATTEPEKVLGTIRSRTHHYPFRLIAPSVLRPYLEQLCESEGVTVEPLALPLVVRAGGGSARDSLSVLDQLIAGSGPEGVTYARAVALLGVTDNALIDEMIDALAAGDGAAAFAAIDRVAEAGHDSRRYANDLLERLRDLIILRQVPDAAEKGLIDVPEEQLARMHAQAGQLGPATLSRCADIVANGLVEMRGATSPRLLLELLAARMLLPAADSAGNALLQRLERLESGFVPGAARAAADQPTRPQPESGHALSDTVTSPASAGSGRAAAREAAASAAARSSSSAGTRPAPAAAGRDGDTAPRGAVPAQDGGQAADAGPEHDAARGGSEPQQPARTVAHDSGGAHGDPAGAVPRAAAPANGQPTQAAAARGTSEAARRAAESWGETDAPAARPAASAAPAARSAAPAQAAAAQPAVSSGGADNAVAVRRSWDEIVRMVGRSSKKAAAFAREAVVRDIDGSTLVLVFKHRVHANGVENDPAPLLDAVHQVLGGNWQLRCEVGGDQRPAASRTTAAAPASAPPRNAPARSAEPARRPAATSGDDWPTPARVGGAAPAQATARRAQAADDGPPLEEPPYDPEFDGPPPPTIEGFDPGDEPTDEIVDAATARQTTEQAAVESLRTSFQLEKLD